MSHANILHNASLLGYAYFISTNALSTSRSLHIHLICKYDHTVIHLVKITKNNDTPFHSIFVLLMFSDKQN